MVSKGSSDKRPFYEHWENPHGITCDGTGWSETIIANKHRRIERANSTNYSDHKSTEKIRQHQTLTILMQRSPFPGKHKIQGQNCKILSEEEKFKLNSRTNAPSPTNKLETGINAELDVLFPRFLKNRLGCGENQTVHIINLPNVHIMMNIAVYDGFLQIPIY